MCLLAAAGAWAQAPAAGPAAAPEAAADGEPRFDVFEFIVEGNTVLPVTTIEQAVYPHLGLARRFEDVEAARKALETAYREAGYSLATVDIPEQRADSGLIRLVVSEGRVARTRVVGARYYSQGYILSRVTEAAEGQVPHMPTFQAQLLDVNRNADRRVAPVLRPGAEPGTTEVDLNVTDQLPLHGSLSLNNQASRNTSATRLVAALSYDNVAQRDHSLGLQAVLSPEASGEVQVLSASYSMPRGPAGLAALSFSATRSDSEVFAVVNDSRLFGKGQTFGVRRSMVLEVTERSFQLLTLGVDYKDVSDSSVLRGNFDPGSPVTYLPLSLGWTGVFQLPPERLGGGEWQLSSALSGGLRGLVNDQTEFANKRFRAQAQYFLLKLDARHSRTLPWWGLRLRAQAEMQLAPAPLISNEQFVLGGANSVRGYLEAEAVGDQGLRGSLQLSTPDLAARLGWPLLAAASLHTFIDAGVAELRRPLPEQPWRFRLLGVGFGGQLVSKGSYPISLSLEVGWPLLKRDTVGSDGLRAHANASIGF
ncbi:hypothetical protein D621_14850 [beta proteobacterium AAP51]|nr:hypothetical protein D621_14850 [beta proteobacterium AAP51]